MSTPSLAALYPAHLDTLQARTAEGEPDRKRQLHEQRAQLEPRHELRLAQALVQRAEQAKEQGWCQGEGQHAQVHLHVAAHFGGHLSQPQHRGGCQQRGHAHHDRNGSEVQRLPHRAAHFVASPGAVQFSPHRQQRLQHTHQRDVHADENRGADRQCGQCALGVAAGDDGVGHAEGHHGQLADQHGAGVPSDQAPFAAGCAHWGVIFW